MNEVLSGMRFTFGGLVVMSLWSWCAFSYFEHRVQSPVAQTSEQEYYDRLLLEVGPGESEAENRRHSELLKSSK